MKRLFSRAEQPPNPVRAAVADRVLASAESAEGSWLVGTRHALVVVPPDAGERVVVPWEQVQRADWDLDTSKLTVEQVEEFGAPVTPMVFAVAAPGPFLQLLRERVSASIVVQQRVVLERRRGLTVIGRRPPSRPGEVTWAYELDKGVDPADPAVLAAAEAGLREAQESLGL
ncbi:MAG TPA: hypothetical protein VFG63_00620 [Nocardioidaceae bacterium]|nr:hypothetical protein [Nocardioidaceae bacterium]